MNFILSILFLFSQLVIASGELDAKHFAVKESAFEADYFPGDLNQSYGVIVLTGSSGGKLNELASTLNGWGHPVLSLAYFDKEGDGRIPQSLELIPLEYIDKAKDWLMARQDTRNDGVVLVGLSKGAELALVLAAHHSDYKGVVAVAPSSVVWSGIPLKPQLITSAESSWAEFGKGLEYVPYVDREALKEAGQKDMLAWHEVSLAKAENASASLIRVEDINSPLLLLSGGLDKVWPANAMAASICARMKVVGRESLCTHINFQQAGHMAGLEKEGSAVYEQIAEFLGALNR